MRAAIPLFAALLAGCEVPGRSLNGVWANEATSGATIIRGDSIRWGGYGGGACAWEPLRVWGTRLTRGDGWAYRIERRTPSELVLRPEGTGFWEPIRLRKQAGLPITAAPLRLERIWVSQGGSGLGGPFAAFEVELDSAGVLRYHGQGAVPLVGAYRADGQRALFERIEGTLQDRLFEVEGNGPMMTDMGWRRVVLYYNGHRFGWRGTGGLCGLQKAVRELLQPLPLAAGDFTTLPLRHDTVGH